MVMAIVSVRWTVVSVEWVEMACCLGLHCGSGERLG